MEEQWGRSEDIGNTKRSWLHLHSRHAARFLQPYLDVFFLFYDTEEMRGLH